MSDSGFSKLEIDRWRQFHHIDISFHQRLTVLTGANGAGKTTLLNILAQHFGWSIPFVGTPTTESRGVYKYISDIWEKVKETLSAQPESKIGKITYRDGKSADLTLPTSVGQTYSVSIRNQQAVPGLFISSHRPVYQATQVSNIPTSLNTRDHFYSTFSSGVRNRLLGGGGQSPNFHIKEALISWAVFGHGNKVVTPNEQALTLFNGFCEILRIVLPAKLGFERLEIRMPEVVLVTSSGTFSLDAVSGGVASVISLAWEIYLFGTERSSFIVLIDEPENHLHPEMQRSLLPGLVQAFPKATFIVATHNPFIISSNADSNVYALNYNAESRVESVLLDLVNKSGTSNEILREVLGVPVTLPLWVDERLQRTLNEYLGKELHPADIKRLREELASIGMGRLIPEAFQRLLSGCQND